MINKLCYEQKQLTMGTMGTQKVSQDEHALHYWARENKKGEVDILMLKPDGNPTAMIIETVEMDVFNARFKDCSTHKCELKKLTPEEAAKVKTDAMVEVGNQHLEKKEFNSAAFEFGQALKIDDKKLEAHLGKGKAHIALGEPEKAKEHFQKMADIDELFNEDNKHVLNELGIELRRDGMHKEALENYRKALEMDPADEALYFNMARAFKEAGNKAEAAESIKKALELKPDFAEAKELLKSLG
ncbi:MAG: tetratricopeptide repeat protein [Nitrospinae bacterium]|nr:tetratricopeptide repeat protein [Nitrospinota bacterium]